MSVPQKTDQALRAILRRREINRECAILRVDDSVKDVIPSLRPRIVAALLRALRSPIPLVRTRPSPFGGFRIQLQCQHSRARYTLSGELRNVGGTLTIYMVLLRK